MELSLQSLEDIVNPLELVHVLGENLYSSPGGKYITNCPKCESKLFLFDREFVCENYTCTFRAGTGIDYLVAKGICKWDTAIETLNRIFDGKLKNTVFFQNQKLIAQKLKAKRKIFDFFLRQTAGSSVSNIKSVQYRSAIRSQGLDPDVLRHSVFIVGAAETEHLQNLIREFTGEKISQLNGHMILLPYFSSVTSISHIIALRSPEAKPEKLSISPARTAYFGLLQRHPACIDTHLAFTYAEASKLNTQYSRTNPESVCLHMMHDASAEQAGITLAEAKYVTSGDSCADLRTVGLLQRYIPSLQVFENKVGWNKDSNLIPSDEFILRCVIQELKKKVPINSILPLLELNHSSRQALLEKLHANRYFEEAEEVRTFFKTLPIYKDDKVTLFSSPYGYTMKKHASDNYSFSVSNFTIELEKNIVFTESTDIFHSGQVVFNNEHYPFVLKQEELDRIADVEKAVRRATVQYSTDELNIPTIKERAASKYLTSYLREQVAQLPRVEGVPMLGWSPRRTSFYSTYFIADRKGIREGKKYLHPNITTLQHYSVNGDFSANLHHDLPQPIVNILNQAAAFIVRSFLSMQIRPLPIYNNAEARRLFAEMFAPLGQTSLLQLNHNMRGEEMPGLRGFPFYAVGYTSGQINKSSLPGFILCDSGTVINENYDVTTIKRAQSTMRFIVQKIAAWALETLAENFQQAHSVSRANAYSIEGAKVIIDACGLLSWPSSTTPFENLDSLLSTISFEDVKNYFVRDINAHKLHIKKEALSKVQDIPGLEKELKSLAKTVQLTDGAIDVDSESMMEALNSFYHMQPTLTEEFNAEQLMDKFKLN